MRYPILILCEIMENIPSYAEVSTLLLAPCLLHYARIEETMLECIDCLGACAVYGGPCFDNYCGQAITLLLQLYDSGDQAHDLISPDSDLNILEVAVHAFSALFKISVYREHALEGTAAKLLHLSLDTFPIIKFCDEAKVVHKLFIQLLEKKDNRLLGATGHLENLSQVCTLIFCSVLHYRTVLYYTILYYTVRTVR